MNYRHAFHAGNFADCVKHALLVWLLRAMQRKPAPVFVLDTHAGAGAYDLAGGPEDGREIKFWFPGGSSSPVLTKDDLDVPYDFDSMAKAGSMLGSGAVIVVDDSHTVLEVALKLQRLEEVYPPGQQPR